MEEIESRFYTQVQSLQEDGYSFIFACCKNDKPSECVVAQGGVGQCVFSLLAESIDTLKRNINSEERNITTTRIISDLLTAVEVINHDNSHGRKIVKKGD